MAGGPSHPRQDRAAPSLPAAPLCSPRSPRGSAGRAPGARRRSRPCRRSSGGGGRLRARGRLTRETKARSPWPAAPLPAGRCLQGKQCAAHRSPARRRGHTRGCSPRSLLPTATGRSSPAELAPRLQHGFPRQKRATPGGGGRGAQPPRRMARSKGVEVPRDSSEQTHSHSAPAVPVPVAGCARAPAIRPGRWRRRDGQRPWPMGGAEGPGSDQWTARRAAAGAGRGVGSGHRPHAAARAAAASARPAGAALHLRLRLVPAVTAVMRGLARKLARGAAPGAAVPAGSRPAPRPPLGTAPAPSGSVRVRSLCFKKNEIPHKVLLRGASRRAA